MNVLSIFFETKQYCSMRHRLHRTLVLCFPCRATLQIADCSIELPEDAVSDTTMLNEELMLVPKK